VASYRRQLRSIQGWLPAGWYIAAVFADVESGGLDLEDRSRTGSWQVLTGAGLQRDGGIADMLAEAASPEPRFAIVACEDIERSARDTFNALKIEKELARNGIMLAATDEPPQIEGANATMILVRRVKQGVAEWYRLQLKEKVWKGLQEHHLAGWNTGPVPYGYAPDRHPHPNPMKAGMGQTRHKLAEDPDTAMWVPRIFEWRILDHLALTAIARRLDELGAPRPAGRRWAGSTVDAILKNPKYTGYMVWGRSKRNGAGRSAAMLKVPADQWLWSPEPTHPALIDLATWKEAQNAGKQRGTVRDRETPARRDTRAPLRGRIRHNQCQRVLTPRPHPYKDHVNLYYACTPDMNDPRAAARYPGHVCARLADKLLTTIIAGVLDQRVFGADRAAMLTAQLPATAADKTADRDRQAAALRRQLKKIETSQAALMTELEETGADPAAADYRQRIRSRYRDRAAERTAAEQQLTELETQTAAADDPALLDAVPRAAGKFTAAPPEVREALYTALDVQILYRPDQNQMTIWVTITDATPQAIQNLLDDPRTDNDTSHPAQPGHAPSTTASSTLNFGTPAQHTLVCLLTHAVAPDLITARSGQLPDPCRRIVQDSRRITARNRAR
jgi:DNA invertase Pin-like site-specific DNA recombinase